MIIRNLALISLLLTSCLASAQKDKYPKDAAPKKDNEPKPVTKMGPPVDPDAALLMHAGFKTSTPSLLSFFRKRALTEEDQHKIAELIKQLGHDDYQQRDEAEKRLSKEWGPVVIRPLQQALKATDAEIVRRARRCLEVLHNGPGPELPSAAARLLTSRKSQEAIPLLIRYLPFADDDTVEDTVARCLVDLTAGKAHPDVKKALKDDHASRRAIAGFVLGRIPDKALQKEVQKLLQDEEPSVRFHTAEGLLFGKDPSAVPVLIDLLRTEGGTIAWQAEELLARLARDKTPPYPVEEKGAKKAYVQAWQEWWRVNAAKVDLASLTNIPPQRGWTLIAQMSQGRVWEVDRNGKERWAITGLSGPIEAIVLTENRILIAEHHGNRITERSRKGAILWEKTVPNNPVSVQRLSNGNTFVTTYQEVLEFRRDGKEVYSYRPGQGSMYGGRKLSNGRIALITSGGTIIEMDSRTGKTIKSFSSGLSGTYSIRGLRNGRYLITSYSQGKVRELDRQGRTTWEYDFRNAYDAEQLPNGNFLVASHGQKKVIEITRSKKIVNELDVGTNIWRVHRR